MQIKIILKIILFTLLNSYILYSNNNDSTSIIKKDIIRKEPVKKEVIKKDTIKKEVIKKDVIIKEIIKKDIIRKEIIKIKTGIKDATVEELDITIIEQEDFENNIDSLTYADVLKEVDWKSVGTKFAIGTTIIVVTGILSSTSPVNPITTRFIFATASLKALIKAELGAAILSILNPAIQSIIRGEPFDKRVIKYAIEGAADGFMWGSILGAIRGANNALKKLKEPSVEIVDGVKSLPKDTVRINKQGHTFRTDKEGRLVEVWVKELKLQNSARNLSSQRKVVEAAKKRNLRRNKNRLYDAGHIIAREFGGSGDIDNLVPMPAYVNRSGRWRSMEREIKKALLDGKRVTDFHVKINYRGKDTVPYSFHVSYKINGVKIEKIIDNRYLKDKNDNFNPKK